MLLPPAWVEKNVGRILLNPTLFQNQWFMVTACGRIDYLLGRMEVVEVESLQYIPRDFWGPTSSYQSYKRSTWLFKGQEQITTRSERFYPLNHKTQWTAHKKIIQPSHRILEIKNPESNRENQCYQCFGNQITVYSHFLFLRVFFWLLFYQMNSDGIYNSKFITNLY